MDPLRPFTNLIRSLSSTTKVESSRPAPSPGGVAPGATPLVHDAMNPLRSRLAALKQWDPGRARELFVEHVLLSELGESLQQDGKFPELVQRVSTHLGSEPALNARLDELLKQLAAGQSVI